MRSADPIRRRLTDHLQRLGLLHTASDLNDLVARATQKRWSPVVQLERLVQAELDATRPTPASNGGSAPRVSGASNRWPTSNGTGPSDLHRPTVDRVFTLDFVAQRRERRPRRQPGAGQDDDQQEPGPPGRPRRPLRALHHRVRLASRPQQPGHRARARAPPPRLSPPDLLAIDEIGYLAYDAHAADLLFQIVSRRYEQRSIVVTTNLVFKEWHTVFPNASCAVALVDRLTHHAEIIRWKGRATASARRRQAQKKKQEQKPKR